MINQRITKLRQLMKERGIDLYIIPTSDFHQSEYVGSYFEARHYMSGFSGSAGTLIVRQEEAYLWTDGRYFIQAEKELAGSCIQLMKMRTPGVPTIKEYVEKYPEATIGFDGRVMPYNQCLFTNTIQANEDLVDLIWQERPELSHEEVYLCHPQAEGRGPEQRTLPGPGESGAGLPWDHPVPGDPADLGLWPGGRGDPCYCPVGRL